MKIELTTRQLFVIMPITAVVVLLGIYFILFGPVINKLKLLYSEYNSLETNILEARDAMDFLKSKGLNKELVSESDISLAIEELTSEGKAKGVNFISLTPGKIEKQQGDYGDYKVLPIDLELESSYVMTGDFLGSLDDLNKSLIRIKKFNIISDNKSSKGYIVKLSLIMYFLG